MMKMDGLTNLSMPRENFTVSLETMKLQWTCLAAT